MAEKEQIIAIAKMLTGLDDEGSAQLDHFKIYTRKEAINCMAKAIEYNLNGSSFNSLAEAALNALLEG